MERTSREGHDATVPAVESRTGSGAGTFGRCDGNPTGGDGFVAGERGALVKGVRGTDRRMTFTRGRFVMNRRARVAFNGVSQVQSGYAGTFPQI